MPMLLSAEPKKRSLSNLLALVVAESALVAGLEGCADLTSDEAAMESSIPTVTARAVSTPWFPMPIGTWQHNQYWWYMQHDNGFATSWVNRKACADYMNQDAENTQVAFTASRFVNDDGSPQDVTFAKEPLIRYNIIKEHQCAYWRPGDTQWTGQYIIAEPVAGGYQPREFITPTGIIKNITGSFISPSWIGARGFQRWTFAPSTTVRNYLYNSAGVSVAAIDNQFDKFAIAYWMKTRKLVPSGAGASCSADSTCTATEGAFCSKVTKRCSVWTDNADFPPYNPIPTVATPPDVDIVMSGDRAFCDNPGGCGGPALRWKKNGAYTAFPSTINRLSNYGLWGCAFGTAAAVNECNGVTGASCSCTSGGHGVQTQLERTYTKLGSTWLYIGYAEGNEQDAGACEEWWFELGKGVHQIIRYDNQIFSECVNKLAVNRDTCGSGTEPCYRFAARQWEDNKSVALARVLIDPSTPRCVTPGCQVRWRKTAP